MNFAVIFAGGVGKRMSGSQIPKQFLEAHGKPIIVYTLEHFQHCNDIDRVIVCCVAGWMDYMRSLVEQYSLTKVAAIVPGGETGQLSIYNGLVEAEKHSHAPEDDIVLIHDGVRPLIDENLLHRNVNAVRQYGSCITCVKVIETIIQSHDQSAIDQVYDRESLLIAKAPQAFRLADILAIHRRALSEGITNSIDSCSLMSSYGYPLHMILGDYKNIKITTPIDYAMFKAILEAENNE